MRDKSIYVIGHLTLDSIAQFEERTFVFDLPQGNALSSSLGAHLWTNDAGIISRIGSDYPPNVLQQLREAGLATDMITSVAVPSLRFWLLWESNIYCQDYPFLSPNWAALTPSIDDIRQGLISPCAVHIAPMPIDTQLTIARFFKVRGALVSIDCQPLDYIKRRSNTEATALLEELITISDIFSPSLSDIARTFPQYDEFQMIRRIAEIGRSVVCLKLGEKGSLVMEAPDREPTHIPVIEGIVRDPTGAGDAYAGAFLAAWVATQNPIRSAACATASASIMIEQIGMLHVLNKQYVAKRRAASLLRTLDGARSAGGILDLPKRFDE
ncbi:MAG: carbohydrate kinase family protein [Rhodoblastus sp.]|nr:carbohydrate kinase family protein [Rhodoblastus sp.]